MRAFSFGFDAMNDSPQELLLRPADRIKARAHFQRTQEHGRKHHTTNFLVLVLPREDGGPTRVGITVTKKVGNAVQRNRIKRIVREVFRRERSRFPSGCDVVWIAKTGCGDMTYAKVSEQVPRRWTFPVKQATPPAGKHVAPPGVPR